MYYYRCTIIDVLILAYLPKLGSMGKNITGGMEGKVGGFSVKLKKCLSLENLPKLYLKFTKMYPKFAQKVGDWLTKRLG